MIPANLDKGLLALLTQMAESGVKPFHQGSPEAARGVMKTLFALSGPGPEMAKVENKNLDGKDGTFRIRALVPHGAVKGVIVYYHGGGWVAGTIDDYDTLGRTIAKKTGCSVVLVDYRLAPEHRYPVAVDDAWVAFNWALDNRAALGGADLPILVAGDSAGGNLSAVIARRARDAGKSVALQALVYPATGFDPANASYNNPENQLLLTTEDMLWFWNHYAPDLASRQEPDAAPLKVANLAGLAPAVVITAEYDVLRDEGEAYAKALENAGVPVTFKRFEGQTHGFFTMVNVHPVSMDGINFIAAAIEKVLH